MLTAGLMHEVSRGAKALSIALARTHRNRHRPASAFDTAPAARRLPAWIARLVVAIGISAAFIVPLPASASAASGLVAAYGFNEGSGTTVTDASGNGNDGTIENATWVSSGKFGTALRFNGTNALVSIPDSPSLHLSSGMTLEAWVHPTQVPNAWSDIVYKGDDNYYLEGTSDHQGVPAGAATSAGTRGQVFADSPLSVNQWTHLAITYDGATLRLYQNGNEVAETPMTGAIVSSTHPLELGGDSIYGQYFSGLIDEVRIYNFALSPGAIQTDMATPIGVQGSPSPPPSSGGGSASTVGTAAEPSVACDNTINVGASVQNALAAAAPGDVVCLNAGNWPTQTITGLTPASPGVTLAAKPGADVSMDGLDTNGQTNNLTVEGIQFSGGFHILAGANNVTVRYDNFQNFDDYAVQGCSVCVNAGPTITGLNVVYNQIDHVAYCLRGTGNMSDWTFSHNVCGPGIGYDGSSDDHYTQTEGIDGLTMDNNAFEGPFDSGALAAGAHNNVTHACGNNLEFDNNIVWHAQSRAQTVLWGDDCGVDGARATNNLFVEDPLGPTTVALWAENGYGTTAATFSNNTIVGNATGTGSGGIFARSGITSMTVQNNIAVGSIGNTVGDFALGSCSTCSGNVADDGSGDTLWVPNWQNTSWTPHNGSPWSPPASNYYKPSGIASSSGYQGTVGP